MRGANPTSEATIGRMSGQNRSAHRGSVLAPWLQPKRMTWRCVAAWIVRTASTTYSAATWMSPSVWFGTVTVQKGMCCGREGRFVVPRERLVGIDGGARDHQHHVPLDTGQAGRAPERGVERGPGDVQ